MSTATTSQLHIAEAFLRALRAKDWVAMRELVADDAVWTLPGTSLISGEARGGDAVVARAQVIASYGLNVALDYVLYGQTNVALSLHNTARRGELALDEHHATVCRLRDGRIAGIDTYFSDVDMVNAFFV
jgi:uncharacterized protein